MNSIPRTQYINHHQNIFSFLRENLREKFFLSLSTCYFRLSFSSLFFSSTHKCTRTHPHQSWAFEDGLLGGTSTANVGTQYLRSLYWAVTTAATIGYGDIRANSFAESAFVIAAVFLGALFYQVCER